MAKKDSVQMLRDKIELLKKARRLIKNGTRRYICYALDDVSNRSQWDAKDALGDYILRNLRSTVWFDSWIAKKRPDLPQDKKSMQNYRLQWIDWMIQCLNEDLEYKLAKGKK